MNANKKEESKYKSATMRNKWNYRNFPILWRSSHFAANGNENQVETQNMKMKKHQRPVASKAHNCVRPSLFTGMAESKLFHWNRHYFFIYHNFYVVLSIACFCIHKYSWSLCSMRYAKSISANTSNTIFPSKNQFI